MTINWILRLNYNSSYLIIEGELFLLFGFGCWKQGQFVARISIFPKAVAIFDRELMQYAQIQYTGIIS